MKCRQGTAFADKQTTGPGWPACKPRTVCHTARPTLPNCSGHSPCLPPFSVHQGEGVALNPPYVMEQMQCYIKYARAIKPRLTEQVRMFGCWYCLPALPSGWSLRRRSR